MFPGADKLAHILAYATLALTVFWCHGPKGLQNPRRVAMQTVLVCLLYGLSDEYHQSFIALRSASALDILADTTGALLVSLVWLNSSALRRKIIHFQTALAVRLNVAS